MKARHGFAIGLTLVLMGCDAPTSTKTSMPTARQNTPEQSNTELASMTLVKLKLPFMT